jgi:hypothetical protein
MQDQPTPLPDDQNNAEGRLHWPSAQPELGEPTTSRLERR